MTFEELLKTDCEEVIVLSYGYMDRTPIIPHFEPFRTQHEITFVLWKEDELLYHENFWFDYEEKEEFYEKDGKYYCNDPEISYRDREEEYSKEEFAEAMAMLYGTDDIEDDEDLFDNQENLY